MINFPSSIPRVISEVNWLGVGVLFAQTVIACGWRTSGHLRTSCIVSDAGFSIAMGRTPQAKWKATVDIHLRSDDCDIAWAALELVSARRREYRRIWISAQVDTWLGGMVAQIRSDISSGVVNPVADSTKHISRLEIRFNDSAVRERLMKLMGTETVRILDRNFMATFADRLMDQNWEMIKERIQEREKWELDREKQMVLDGMIPITDGPEGFSEHPYFAIMRQVADEVAKKKAKMEAHQVRKRMNKMFDYSSLPVVFKEETDASTLSVLALIQDSGEEDTFDLIMDDDSNKVVSGGSQDENENAEIDLEGLTTGRYEAPEVKNLRKARTVEEMYRLADSIFFAI